MKSTFLILAVGLALFDATTSKAERLVIKGSDTLGAKLVPQLAEQFKAEHADATFDIAAEGSTTGFAALIDGTAQIGMSSRPAKPAETAAASAKGVTLKETTVAYDGVAVIVNAANPVKGLTKKQVEQIFTGEVADWSGGRRFRRRDLDLYPQHFVRHLFGVQGTRDEEARLRSHVPKNGGQRADRGRSR